MLSSKYPHPQEQSWMVHVEAVNNRQIARIAAMANDLMQRDPVEFENMTYFARLWVDDLNMIENELSNTMERLETRQALENLIAAMNDVDDLVDDDNRPAIAAALKIEEMARTALEATLCKGKQK